MLGMCEDGSRIFSINILLVQIQNPQLVKKLIYKYFYSLALIDFLTP